MPWLIQSSGGISAVLFIWASCTPVQRLSARSAVLSKVSFSISSENQTHEHSSE